MSSNDASVAAPSSKPSSVSLAALFQSPLDARIAHINRVLSTSSGVDATLCFVGYGLGFVSGQLNNLAAIVGPTAEKAAPSAVATYAPSLAANLTDAASSAKIFGGLCSDVRMFMRLWGLLKIWAGAKATYANPPKDLLLRVLAWSQLSSMATYLVLENGFYLGSKGVLKGWTPSKLVRTFRLAVWVFLGYIVVDYARLWRVWQLRQAKVLGGEKEDKIELARQDAAWWRALQVDLAYSPLCFHWGLEGWQFTESWAGFLGACAGFVGFREALRVTAP